MADVYERFTERARRVMTLAQDEAREMKHGYIGTEHILLGLIREEEGLAARVLQSLQVAEDDVRGHVARIVGQSDEVSVGQIPLTPRARRVLELSLREALSLGHNYIGTEHLLLGLVRENEGVAARILLNFDADPEKVRNEVIRMLTGPKARPTEKPDDLEKEIVIHLDGQEIARSVAKHQQRQRARNPVQRRGPHAVDVSAFTSRPDHKLSLESGELNLTVEASGLSDQVFASIHAAVLGILCRSDGQVGVGS